MKFTGKISSLVPMVDTKRPSVTLDSSCQHSSSLSTETGLCAVMPPPYGPNDNRRALLLDERQDAPTTDCCV